jgi:DNA-binding SARP family transcriptional activator
MAPTGETRIQLCGRLVVRLEGQRVEDSLPGALGQLLFAYLVVNRHRRVERDELLIAAYGEEATAQALLTVPIRSTVTRPPTTPGL